MPTIRIHFLDASAIIKLLIREAGSGELWDYLKGQSNFYTTSLCFGESMGRFKSKYLKLNGNGYLFASNELLSMLSTGEINIEEPDIKHQDVIKEVEEICVKYGLDVADAFQIVTLKRSFKDVGIGESKPILITADSGLAAAARAENLRVWNCETEPAP
jgi:predicted nucleic acid-binding protein